MGRHVWRANQCGNGNSYWRHTDTTTEGEFLRLGIAVISRNKNASRIRARQALAVVMFSQFGESIERSNGIEIRNNIRSFGCSPKSQVPSPRSQVPGPRSQVPSPKSQVPSPKSQVPNPKSQIPNPKSKVPRLNNLRLGTLGLETLGLEAWDSGLHINIRAVDMASAHVPQQTARPAGPALHLPRRLSGSVFPNRRVHRSPHRRPRSASSIRG